MRKSARFFIFFLTFLSSSVFFSFLFSHRICELSTLNLHGVRVTIITEMMLSSSTTTSASMNATRVQQRTARHAAASSSSSSSFRRYGGNRDNEERQLGIGGRTERETKKDLLGRRRSSSSFLLPRRKSLAMTRAQSEADAVGNVPSDSSSSSSSSNSSSSSGASKSRETTNLTTPVSKDQFVNFFRMALPYITMHKSSTFVIHIPGNVMKDKKSNVFKSVMQDIIILRELGVKLVLVLGSDSQISDLTILKGEKPKFSVSRFGATRRITDEYSLEAAMEACGRNNIAVQAQLTRGPDVRLTRKHGDHYSDTGGFGGDGSSNSSGRNENSRDSRNTGRNFPVATSGNYVYARRRGVVDGVDYGLTGEVVKIDKTSILETLEQGDVVLLSSLGFNAAGEVFNCVSRDIALAAAIELNADKLIVLPEDGYLPRDETGTDGKVKSYFTLSDAKNWMKNFAKGTEYEELVENHRAYAWLRSGYANNNGSFDVNNSAAFQVNSWMRAQEMDYEWRVPSCPIEMCAATFACHCGVKRVHMVDPNKSGSLLVELFTSDGEGTMIAGDRYEGTRKATIYDCIGIHDMLQPLADAGIVVYRTEEELRRSVMSEKVSFFVTERDGNIIACASLTEYENGKSYEIGSFAVAREYRREGRGDALLSYLEEHASEKGCERLFLLTTRTAEWFTSRGFEFDGAAEESSSLPKGKEVVKGRGSLLFSKYMIDSESD